MSIEDWALVLQTRSFISEEFDYFAKQKALGKEEDYVFTQEDVQKMADLLKYKRFSLVDSFDYFTVKNYIEERSSNPSFSTPSVNSLTVIESWDIAKDGTFGGDIYPASIYQKNRDKHMMQTRMLDYLIHRMGELDRAKNTAKAELTAESLWEYRKEADKIEKAHEEYTKEFDGDENYHDFIREAHRTPYDFRHKQYCNRDYISPQAHVTIDLDATDEQIENDFSHWLTHYRKASGYRIPKKKAHEKLFNQTTFDFWIKHRFIPYLDLMLIAKIEGKTITQEKYGELIFPNESIENPAWSIGHLIKPEAERLMEDSTRWSLLQQAAAGARKKQRVDRYGNKQKKKK